METMHCHSNRFRKREREKEKKKGQNAGGYSLGVLLSSGGYVSKLTRHDKTRTRSIQISACELKFNSATEMQRIPMVDSKY